MTGDDEQAELTRSVPDTSAETVALRAAVELAGHAPSLFNAQPWSWRVDDDVADLSMDPEQRFPVTDPDNREMSIGCGAALNHVQLALTAAGWRFSVDRLPGPNGDWLARVRLTGPCDVDQDVDQDAVRLVDAIPRRHTDRRPFSLETVGAELLEALQLAADEEGVHLQIVTRDEDRIWLSILADRAAALQSAQKGYPDELARVTGAHDATTNIPAGAVPHVVSPRHSDVALRDFELLEPGSLTIPESADEHPVWCVLWTDRDGPLEWLEAGEALSRLLLHATDLGLATGVQSQPVEIPMIRAQLDEHLLSGLGHAQVLVRIGWPGA